MRNAELPGQNLERMRRLTVVNGNGVGDHSDVECDDEFYDDKCFSRPTPAARRSGGAAARPGSAPPPPLRRFHSRAPSSDCVSLLDEITGSLPTMDPTQPMPFPESNYSEEDSSDDVQLQEPRRRKRGPGGGRAKGDSYRSDLVIYQAGSGQQQQQQYREANGPAHLDSLTTATGFTSFGDDLTSFNTSVADMPSMPRPKNHQERIIQ